MKRKFNDQDVLKLLSVLKKTTNDYPTEMLQPRRTLYMKQVAAMVVLSSTAGIGTRASEGGASGSGVGAGAGLFPLGKFLETALVITIVVEAGVAAYIYRDQIADFINSTFFPAVESPATPTADPSITPAVVSVLSGGLMTESPAATATVTVTVTVTGTPFPIVVTESSVPNVQVDSNPQIGYTPAPVDNPGNQYGNTPKPERTKDSGNNSSGDQDTNKEKKEPKK